MKSLKVTREQRYIAESDKSDGIAAPTLLRASSKGHNMFGGKCMIKCLAGNDAWKDLFQNVCLAASLRGYDGWRRAQR